MPLVGRRLLAALARARASTRRRSGYQLPTNESHAGRQASTTALYGSHRRQSRNANATTKPPRMATITPTKRLRSILRDRKTVVRAIGHAALRVGSGGGKNLLVPTADLSFSRAPLMSMRMASRPGAPRSSRSPPKHVVAIVMCPVPLAWQQDEVEALVRANQRIDDQ